MIGGRMKKEELKNKVIEIMKQYPVASIATIKDGKPWVRYMATQTDEEMNLWTTSFAQARKIAQIKKDKNVHATLGADPKDWNKPYVNIIGTAEILTDSESKKKCWHEVLAQFFSGPEDPNYVVIKISPKTIEYMSPEAMEPEIYTA